MKKLILSLAIIAGSMNVFSQTFSVKQDVKDYINAKIIPNTTRAITPDVMKKILLGLWEFDADSIWLSGTNIKYRRGSLVFTIPFTTSSGLSDTSFLHKGLTENVWGVKNFLNYTTGLAPALSDSSNIFITSGWFKRYLAAHPLTETDPVWTAASANYYTKVQSDARFVPLTRNITINGTTHDLSIDRSWTIPAVDTMPLHNQIITKLDAGKRVSSISWAGNDSVHVLVVHFADGTNVQSSVFDRGSGGGGGSSFDTSYIYYHIDSLFNSITEIDPVWISDSADYYTKLAVNDLLALKVPTARTITINGTTLDLSADRSWTVENPLTFTNGLTRSTNTIKLGGTFVNTTSIASAGFNFDISGQGNKTLYSESSDGTQYGQLKTFTGGGFSATHNWQTGGNIINGELATYTVSGGGVSKIGLLLQSAKRNGSSVQLSRHTIDINNDSLTIESGGTEIPRTNFYIKKLPNKTTVSTDSLLILTSGDKLYKTAVPTPFTTADETDPLYTANGVPKTTTITINGTAFDLSANRSWSVGTVTNVATGFGLSGGPITTTGTVAFDSTAGGGFHTQPYNDLRYLQSFTEMDTLAILKTGTTILTGDVVVDANSLHNFELLNTPYFHVTTALDTIGGANVRAHHEFASRDVQHYISNAGGDQMAGVLIDWNPGGRNNVEIVSTYDPGSDAARIILSATQGGTDDGKMSFQMTNSNFRYKTPAAVTTADKLAVFDIAGANGYGAKMGTGSVLAPLLFTGGNLYADTSAGSSHLATQYFVSNSEKGSPTYIVAASNAPAVLKARADYVCDGTADEVEIKAALLLGNVTLTEGDFTLTSGVLMPSNRTLSGTGKGTRLIASGMATGFGGTADSSSVMVGNSGSEGITVRDMTIDGNVNTSWAILFTSVGSLSGDTAIAGARVQNVYIKNISSSGIELRNCWNNLIHGNVMNKVYNDGITLTRTTGANHTTRTVVSNNIINGGFAAFFSTYADTTILSGNNFNGQVDISVQIENSNEINMINNIVTNGDDYNVYFNTCVGINMIGNTVTKNNGAGEIVAFFSCSKILANDNKISNSTRDGIRLDDCQDATVSNNNIYNNGTSSNDTYSGINLSGSDDISIIGNIIKRGSATNKQKYGITISSGSDRTVVEGNNLYLSGVTSDLNTANSTTRSRNNTANDGTWKDLLYTAAQFEMSTSKILGRTTASQGKAEEIGVGYGLDFSSLTLKADTTSSTGLVSKDRLTNALALQVYTASNGVVKSTNDFQWGGTTSSGSDADLSRNTYIDANGHTLGFVNSGSGSTMEISASSSAYAVSVTSTSGIIIQTTQTGLAATSTGSFSPIVGIATGSANPADFVKVTSTTNAVQQSLAVQTTLSSGTAANGLGTSIDYYADVSTGSTALMGRVYYKWTDATNATRSAQAYITGVYNTVEENFANFQTGGIVIVNNGADTLSTKAYARSVGGGGGGGSGTVTDFSAGDLSPLFTTSEATTTTTPALTFSLSNAAAHTFFGNNTGSSGAPAYVAIGQADVTNLVTDLAAKQSTTLADGKFLVGNGSSVATAVTPTGDVTFDNTGLFAIASGVIVNADINASAAIDYSKLSLTGAIVSADLAGSIDATKIADGSVTSTEFQYINTLSSNAQTQIDGKLSNSTTSTQDGYFGDLYLKDDVTPSHYMQITQGDNLTANRILTLKVNDAARTIDLSGNLTVSSAATISGTNTGDQTTVSGNAGTATALQNARTIGGVSFDGTANITVASATGGFTVSGGDLALGANNITLTGSIGATGARSTKGWFTNLEITNMPTVGGTSLSSTFAPIASPTFTGTVTLPASTSFTTPVLGAATGTSLVLSSFLNEAKGADIASATTTDIGAATGNYVDVTGTVTITGFGTVQAGTRRIVRFTGALTLTHNATSLILPGGANITTVAGDVATFVSLGSGNWRCVSYTKTTVTGTGGTVLSASPTFTGTVTIPTSFVLGATTVTTTGTQLNYLNAATGTTGTNTTNLVYSTSPTLVTPNLGTPSTLVLTNATGLPSLNKAISLAAPTASETIDIFYTTAAITVTEVREVLRGSSPSVTYALNYGSSPTSATNTIVASHAATSTSGAAASLNITSIPAGSYIWLTTSATSGTVNNFHFTMTYTQ